MSKNITIQEGGVGKQITVDKIKTNAVGGDAVFWIPEDNVNLVTKNITENGTYKARTTDNAYGYSQVKVNVPGGNGSADSSGVPTSDSGVSPGGPGSAIIGVDPSDGETYGYGVDEGGNVVKTRLPTSIQVSKAPDKTSYSDGETIDFSGIIVTLHGGDSALFVNSDYPNGRVPFSELIFPVTVAHIPDTSGEGFSGDDEGGSESGGGGHF